MKKRGRYLAIPLSVVLAIGIFAFVPCVQAQTNKALVEGQQAIMEGATQMMEANKKIMAVMEKKGIKDAELTAAQKQMMEGYSLVKEGNGMMAGNEKKAGQAMMKRGAKMMLEAQKTTTAAVERTGMVKVCAIDLSECHLSEQKIEKGALDWYFGGAGVP